MLEKKENSCGCEFLTPLYLNSLLELASSLEDIKIEKIHDDGDLTVTSKGQLYVVTTDGKLFREVAKNPVATISQEITGGEHERSNV